MGSRVFLSPETELFFVKTHIIHALAETTSEAYGLSPVWRHAITQTNAQLLSIGLLGTNFSEIRILILTFSFKQMCLKTSSAKWRPLSPYSLKEVFKLSIIDHIHNIAYMLLSNAERWP